MGAGTMGQQIGPQCAIHGYEVILYEFKNRKSWIKPSSVLQSWQTGTASTGRIVPEMIQQIISRIKVTSDPSEAAQDIFMEPVPRLRGGTEIDIGGWTWLYVLPFR